MAERQRGRPMAASVRVTGLISSPLIRMDHCTCVAVAGKAQLFERERSRRCSSRFHSGGSLYGAESRDVWYDAGSWTGPASPGPLDLMQPMENSFAELGKVGFVRCCLDMHDIDLG